jgi:phage protein D
VLPWITSVTVEDHVHEPARFTLELISRDDGNGTLPWSDDKRFDLGASVAIGFGYGGQFGSVIAGEITSLSPAFTAGGSPTLTVCGEDLRHRLNTVRRLRPAFLNQKYSDIAAFVCREQHVPVEAVDSNDNIVFVQQAFQTDLEFLRQCASRCFYELAMDGRTLLFQPVLAGKKSGDVTLTFEDDLLEFQPSLALLPLTELQLPAWDIQNKELMSTPRADKGAPGMKGARSAAQVTAAVLGRSVESAPSISVGSPAERDRWADSLWQTAALDYITGSGRCRGRTDLRAGNVIGIAGVGGRFSGDYYITRAAHQFKPGPGGGYTVDFTASRSASS